MSLKKLELVKTGSPGFIPERLVEAREARGLSVSGLAELVALSRQSVHDYERGRHTPQPEVLDRLAVVLHVPSSFLFRKYDQRPAQAIHFRSLKSTTKTARTSSANKLTWLQRVTTYLLDFLELPSNNIPALYEGAPLGLSDAEVERAAQATRRHWGMGDGPIPDVVLEMENAGAVVMRLPLLDRKIDAFSCWSPVDGRAFVVLNADKGAAVRSRFDAAHELAHLVLHRHITPSDQGQKEVYDRMEEQAHMFAGAFLLPAETFGREFLVPSIDGFLNLKRKWGVSVGAMIKRTSRLGLAPDDVVARLWRDYGRRGWRSGEPFDDELPMEKPRLLRRSIELLLQERVQTAEDLLDELALADSDVEAIAGLPGGYLSAANIRFYPPPRLRDPNSGPDGPVLGPRAPVHQLRRLGGQE